MHAPRHPAPHSHAWATGPRAIAWQTRGILTLAWLSSLLLLVYGLGFLIT